MTLTRNQKAKEFTIPSKLYKQNGIGPQVNLWSTGHQVELWYQLVQYGFQEPQPSFRTDDKEFQCVLYIVLVWAFEQI
jgi:hypothetical protein